MKTKCNNCGAEEGTQASVGAKCMFCTKGTMQPLCGCDSEAGLLCAEHNEIMMEEIE